MFVSIHIPKTAGTALAKIFDDTSQRRIMYDYGTEHDLTSARTCPQAVHEHRDFIQSYFKYLHGHFHYLKYADVFPNSPVITAVRDPVDRVVSQYLHILRSGNPNNARHKLIMDGEMGIVKFSSIDFIGNAQWYYLEGRQIKDYDFIFVQECLDHSLDMFCQRFNLPEIRDYLSWFDGVPSVNEKPKTTRDNVRTVVITAEDKQKIYNNCERDVEVYRLAKECLKVF